MVRQGALLSSRIHSLRYPDAHGEGSKRREWVNCRRADCKQVCVGEPRGGV